MCSRYAFVPEAAAWVDFRAVFGTLAEELLGLSPLPKLAPTDRVPILIRQPGTPPQVVHARWGLIPHWWSKPELPRLAFNARSEEAAAKPMWRDALRRSRCLIPATSWTEWQHAHGAKIPHTLRRHDGLGFMFAGLWSLWRTKKGSDPFSTTVGADLLVGPENGSDPFFVTCVILTTAAAPGIAAVHERMPIVLAPAAWDAWLDPAQTEAAPALALLQQHTVGALAALTVDRH
jgi:putative SOS response-associated peptidase YedK